MNTVVIGGNLVADPEYREVGDTGVVKFRIISDRKYTSKGEKKTEATGIDLEAWGKTAELINQYVVKGQYVLVKGRLKEDRWQNSDGQNRSKIMISVSDGPEGIQFGQKPKDRDESPQEVQQETNEVQDSGLDIGADVPF